ncbi:MAG: hypothetical protein O3B73_09290 [bacterium]|nr:hypothetical protein [bacterium]
MIHAAYLAKGLSAMSKAHRVNTMAGHLGAAVVAGYFIGEQHPDLDERVYSGIKGELDRIICGESVFSPKKEASFPVAEMFELWPKEQPMENLVDGIAEALATNIDQTRESGHNVIFAAIAIRALKDHSDLATPSVTEGIAKLIAGFNGAKPGSGYFGKELGRIDGRQISLPNDRDFPPYATLQEMACVVIDELIQHANTRRDGFGGLWHIINHAAALAELSAYGYRELATMGLAAHHQHLRLFRAVPDMTDELGVDAPADHDPRTSAFWASTSIRRDRARLDHRIKTLYGFDTLIGLVKDEQKRDLANEKLRYLM